MYVIKKYSYDQAKKLGVTIKPSENKNKKIDVFKDGNFICSIGDSRYKDYPTFLEFDRDLAETKKNYIIYVIIKIMLKELKGGMP